MTIPVNSIVRGEIGHRETFKVNDEPAPAMESGDPVVPTPLNGDITITHDPEGLAIRGNLATTIRLECDRCLTEYDLEITTKIEGLEPEVEEVDLDPLVREAILLAVPFQKLCPNGCSIPLEY